MSQLVSVALTPPPPQPSAQARHGSQLERYLQDELETMRQAFQIRLTQLEKRYQRQLILEQKRGGASPKQSPARSSQVQLRAKRGDATTPHRTSGRRNSWHSALPDEEAGGLVAGMARRSDSTQSLDSDCSVDDITTKPHRGIPDEYTSSSGRDGSGPPGKPGLRGGARGWQEGGAESPRLSPMRVMEEEEEHLTEKAQQLIQSKMAEYRDKMMQYFKERSEARIVAMEAQYQTQMGEVERQAKERASHHLVAMEKRLKDLESRMDVQTLV